MGRKLARNTAKTRVVLVSRCGWIFRLFRGKGNARRGGKYIAISMFPHFR